MIAEALTVLKILKVFSFIIQSTKHYYCGEMTRKLIYIINPISGKGNEKSVKEVIEAETGKAGLPFFIYPSVANGDYSFLHHIIEEDQITDVIIAGGDGTINQVIQSLRSYNVQFGILPCGSGNGLAFSAGIPKNSKKALRSFLMVKAGWIDAFMINDTFGWHALWQ